MLILYTMWAISIRLRKNEPKKITLSIFQLAEGQNGYNKKCKINVKKLKDSAEYWQCRFEEWYLLHALWSCPKIQEYWQSCVIIFKTSQEVISHFASSLRDPSQLCTHSCMREWVPKSINRLSWDFGGEFQNLESYRIWKKLLPFWLK